MILTHLAHMGRASVRMTDEALEGRATAAYPGGSSERADSLSRARNLPADLLLKELSVSIEELDRQWTALSEGDWETVLKLDQIGDVQLTRLLMLRWTEMEVHTSDLGLNHEGFEVSDLFVAAALPLRVGWLVQHHRNRIDADKSVRGTWNLKAADSREAWKIKTPHATEVCTIEGPDLDLLGFILGRVPVSHLTLEGNVGLAYRFKLAFPGP